MSVLEYQDRGPITVPFELDVTGLTGKTVIITGGASGLGKAYAEAFIAAGAYVTIGDLNKERGSEVATKLGSKAQFVPCDIRSFDEQVLLFEAAIKKSPTQAIDIVVANAGVVGSDSLCAPVDGSLAPTKPSLWILDINLSGTFYTAHLAMHYFHQAASKEKADEQSDKCLILKSSLAAYVDQETMLQYSVSKNALRALMRSLRRSAWKDGVRVNCVAPGYIDTPLLENLEKGKLTQVFDFALTEDAVKAVLKAATDKSVNGRSLGVLARSAVPGGVLDMDNDDYKEGNLMHGVQGMVLQAGEKIKSL